MNITGILAFVLKYIFPPSAVIAAITLYRLRSKDNKDYNKALFKDHIKIEYSQCFSNVSLTQTDGVDMYKLNSLVTTVKDFHDSGNHFKGARTNYLFTKVYDECEMIIFNKFFNFNYVVGTRADDERMNALYKKHKNYIIKLKGRYSKFYRIIFGVN